MSFKSTLTQAFDRKAWLGRLNRALGQSALAEIVMAGACIPEDDQTKSGTSAVAPTQGNAPEAVKKAA